MKRLEQYPSLKGKTVLITGANSGLGYEAAKQVAFLEGKLIMASRSMQRLNAAKEAILSEYPKAQISLYCYDQSSPESIFKLVDELKEGSLDAAIYNAGIYFPNKNQEDLTFKTNALGTYLLYKGLSSIHKGIRHVFVTSLAKKKPKGEWKDSIMKAKRQASYGLSKQAVRLIYLKALLEGESAVLCHPGISRTNIIRGYAPWLKRLGNGILYLFVHSPKKAALSETQSLYVPSGSFLVPRGPFHISGYPKNIEKPGARPGEIDALISYLESIGSRS